MDGKQARPSELVGIDLYVGGHRVVVIGARADWDGTVTSKESGFDGHFRRRVGELPLKGFVAGTKVADALQVVAGQVVAGFGVKRAPDVGELRAPAVAVGRGPVVFSDERA